MNIRPLPYYNTDISRLERELAASLRMEFVPKVRRRLAGHHLRGFRHDDIVRMVKRCKQQHPWFVRTDISRFYPSVRYTDLVVGVQLAYRDLLGLEYVPSAFKRTYVGPLTAWCRSLPLTRGIPLGSPLSAIAAPLMLVPVWLELKRRYGVPFLVYVDDVLVFCDSRGQADEVYGFLDRSLSARYGLELNVSKTQSGRFADTRVDFCGWSFAGGYARVSDAKAAAFAERITEACRKGRSEVPQAIIKRLNRKIYGFGHYYKYGDVKKQFAALDCVVRKAVRERLRCAGHSRYFANDELSRLGLSSLSSIYERIKEAPKTPRPVGLTRHFTNQTRAAQPAGNDMVMNSAVLEAMTGIDHKLTQLLALQRRQLSAIERIC